MKSHILFKTHDLYLCGVQNMIRKRFLKIDTVQIPQSLTKNIVTFIVKNTKFALKRQVNLH